MNTTYQQLLELMRGSDSKSPMTLEFLGTKSGLAPSTLMMVIDQMHEQVPALVGKCEITKLGIKQTVVWPTGEFEQKTAELKGMLTIKLDQDGRYIGSTVKTNQPGMEVNVSNGLYMVAG